jgi:hypothetical protein
MQVPSTLFGSKPVTPLDPEPAQILRNAGQCFSQRVQASGIRVLELTQQLLKRSRLYPALPLPRLLLQSMHDLWN